MKGQAQSSSNFERTIFDEGTYQMKLVKSLVMMGKPSQYAPEGAPKIMFIWEYEVEGEKFELTDYLTFPKNFAYNDKSNFWKRVSEIAGVKIGSDNADTVDIDLGEFVQSYDELVDYINTKNDRGGLEKLEVQRLTVGNQSLMGKQCQLVVKQWRKQDGEVGGNQIAAVLQVGGGAGPRKPGAKAPATQQAPQAQVASKPPARPVTPAQADVITETDLPF